MDKILSNLIKINGPLSIADFMNEALFNSKKGYYKTHNPLGKKGDFITAPEISQVFGELIGAYLINIWQNNYNEEEINIVEMGAGKGTLMKDLLNFAAKIPNFKNKVKVHIIEISPKLQKIQKDNLKGCNIKWWENFSAFYQKNKTKPLFFISNELFDCFAINQFIKTKEGWKEKLVTLNQNNELDFILSQNNQTIDKVISEIIHQNNKVEDINKIKEGSVFEYAPGALSLMQELCIAIKNSNGLALIIDYGYIENKFENSLQAIKDHKFCNILENIGNIDITALVNFYSLENIAHRNNLNTSLITQKEFLESLGIEIRRKKLNAQKSKKEQEEINSAIDRLIDTKQMGELFKCLIFWK